MNDLAQSRVVKPKSDDMSMDEILASIRKIISSSDDDSRQSKSHESLYSSNDSCGISTMEKLQNSLSSREQLLSLTRPETYEAGHQISQQKTEKLVNGSYNNQEMPTSTSNLNTRQKPVYQKLSQYDNNLNVASKSVKQNEDFNNNTNNDHDEEILRALNEIRETLSSSYNEMNHLQKKQAIKTSETQDSENNNSLDDNKPKQYSTKIVDATVKDNKEAIYADIDLKPTQFTADSVPEFLRKFKKQQDLEREKNQKNHSGTNYDFSNVPNFDEAGEVINLTEKVMPTTRENLKFQDSQFENNNQKRTQKTSFSKLRQSTEDVIKSVSERNMLNDEDFSEEDSPMANIIMRTLRPMLQEWIDENMQNIAEQVLREEFRRGLK